MISIRQIRFVLSRTFLACTCICFSLNVLAQSPGATPEETSFYQKVLNQTYAVEDPDKQVGSFDPETAPSLPIGLVKTIGDTKYIICIDSAYWVEDAAYFSAYMALEFPGAEKKIAFAAKDIQFNPKGVLGGSQAKLMLISDHLIKLGPNTSLYLTSNGSNYVNWNCNGFESVNLHGEFLFSGEILQPVDPQDTCVRAAFEVNVQDIHNMMTQVDFSPFTVRGLKDFEFNISEASVDMSDYINPPGIAMPDVFHETYGEEVELWRGFHLKNFELVLPEKLSSHEQATKLYGENLFIDESGLTGELGADNLLALHNGKTEGGWGLSVDHFELGFVTNSLSAGAMNGKISVPFLDNNSLKYAASISKNEMTNEPDYYFSAGFNQAVVKESSSLNSRLTIESTSSLSMTVKENKFDPKLVLNGSWELINSEISFDGIEYQNLTLITQAPYVTNGTFGLVGEVGVEMGGFNVSLNELVLGIQNERIGMGADVSMNLGDNPSHISVSSGFYVFAKPEILQGGRQDWAYDGYEINSIHVLCNTSAFFLDGLVHYRNDDPVYGNGFAGELTFGLPSVLSTNFGMKCIFGKVSGYKYWAVDITAPLPAGVTLGSISLTQITGGIYYHMNNTRTVDEIITAAESSATVDLMSPNYVVDQNIGLGFNAGVSYQQTASPKMLNGEVVLGVEFNSNGGLQEILLAGNAYMMVTPAERKGNGNSTIDNKIEGTIAIGYDNQEQIFDAQMTANALFQNAISATIWSQLYISPSLWFFHLGTPSNPCSANAWNFATMSAYFMFGQNLEPMPPPPPQVSSVLGNYSSSRNVGDIASGNGIAAGANLYVGFNKSVNVFNDKWWAYASGYVGAGFDMTFYKYATTTHCAGDDSPFGANYWFMNGQVYAYGGVNAGAMKVVDGEIKQNLNIISASMAMLLTGKLPNPSYFYGGLNLQASVFDIFNLNITLDFDMGTNCQIVN